MREQTEARWQTIGQGILAVLLLVSLALGCQRQPTPAQDEEALKREIEKLNQERAREWQPKQ